MTVKELVAFLSAYPGDMEILETRCSDYGPMSLESWELVEAVPQGAEWGRAYDGWLIRSHPTMSAADHAKKKLFLYFSGN